MSQTLRLQCQASLANIIEKGAEAASIASKDGLPVLSEWRIGANEDLFIAMAAAMYGAADACSQEMAQPSPTAIQVNSPVDFGIYALDADHILVAVGNVAPEALEELITAIHA